MISRNQPFDAAAELAKIKNEREVMRKPYFRRSKLDVRKLEILQLVRQGASLKDLQLWLSRRKIKVATSTISRWLKANREKR